MTLKEAKNLKKGDKLIIINGWYNHRDDLDPVASDFSKFGQVVTFNKWSIKHLTFYVFELKDSLFPSYVQYSDYGIHKLTDDILKKHC